MGAVAYAESEALPLVLPVLRRPTDPTLPRCRPVRPSPPPPLLPPLARRRRHAARAATDRLAPPPAPTSRPLAAPPVPPRFRV